MSFYFTALTGGWLPSLVSAARGKCSFSLPLNPGLCNSTCTTYEWLQTVMTDNME